MEYLFVYGTLRREAGHPMHGVLSRHAGYVGRAACRGRLYDVGGYPGLVPSETPGDRVTGEVYALPPHMRQQVFRLLDRYEGYDPRSPPEAQEYRRAKQTVVLEDGRRLEAWTYLYNRDPRLLRRIPSGDYVAHGRAE